MFARLRRLFRTRRSNGQSPNGRRKVAGMADIFNIAVGWKLLFLHAVQQFVRAYAYTHTHKRPRPWYSPVHATPPSAQIESANPFFLFSSPACRPYIPVVLFLALLFLSVIVFSYEGMPPRRPFRQFAASIALDLLRLRPRKLKSFFYFDW